MLTGLSPGFFGIHGISIVDIGMDQAFRLDAGGTDPTGIGHRRRPLAGSRLTLLRLPEQGRPGPGPLPAIHFSSQTTYWHAKASASARKRRAAALIAEKEQGMAQAVALNQFSEALFYRRLPDDIFERHTRQR